MGLTELARLCRPSIPVDMDMGVLAIKTVTGTWCSCLLVAGGGAFCQNINLHLAMLLSLSGLSVRSAETFVLDVSSQWKYIEPLPGKLYFTAATSLNNKVYLTGRVETNLQTGFHLIFLSHVTGGKDSVSHDDIIVYEDGAWRPLSRMLHKRQGHAVATITVDEDTTRHCTVL